MYQCKECKHVADYQSFVHDYKFDYKRDDEVAILVCPKCGNSDEDEIIELEDDTESS